MLEPHSKMLTLRLMPPTEIEFPLARLAKLKHVALSPETQGSDGAESPKNCGPDAAEVTEASRSTLEALSYRTLPYLEE